MKGGFWEGVLWGMGYKLATEEEKKKCRFCGRLIPRDARYCPYCGKKLKS